MPPPLPSGSPLGINPIVVNGIAAIVVIVWAATAVADFLSMSYEAPAGIHLVAGSVVGGIFAGQIVVRKR